MSDLDQDYAECKLRVLLRDLTMYNAGEFWREMSRIVSGATGRDHAEQLQDLIEIHKDAERQWEVSMIKAAGEDGVGDAVKAIEKIKSERDALAAHVEKLKPWSGEDVIDWVNRANKTFNQSPQASLSEHDAEVARKAIKWAILEFGKTTNTELCDEEDLVSHGEEYSNQYAEEMKIGKVGE